MYVSEEKNCINISFTFDDTKVAEQALLDSGVTVRRTVRTAMVVL